MRDLTSASYQVSSSKWIVRVFGHETEFLEGQGGSVRLSLLLVVARDGRLVVDAVDSALKKHKVIFIRTEALNTKEIYFGSLISAS